MREFSAQRVDVDRLGQTAPRGRAVDEALGVGRVGLEAANGT